MFFVDKWFNGVFGGLFGMFPGTDNWNWMFTHTIEGLIFALPFAWPAVYNKLPAAGWLKGLVYGFPFWLIFPFLLGMTGGALGTAPLQQMAPSPAAGVISVILLHLVYGFFLGVLYNPPESATS